MKQVTSYFIFRPLTPPYVRFRIRRFLKLIIIQFIIIICHRETNPRLAEYTFESN
jgi:hypothetical protein